MKNSVVERLQAGEMIPRHQEGGNSMTPIIKSRQPVDLEPITSDTTLAKGDIVLCRVKGRQVTHKITAIRGNQYQISNNHGLVNGWVTREKIYGRVSKIWER